MARKKKMPTIKSMTVELTAQEVLGLRHIHSNWANSDGNAPFCDAMSDSFLDKLGGYLDCEPLWDHPEAKKWYDSQKECDNCGMSFDKEELKKVPEEDGDELYCGECLEELQQHS